MENKILEFLKETKAKLIEEYLQENCTQIEQREPYGDTDAVVGRFYSDDDCEDAENYAEFVIKQAFDEFFGKLEVKDFDDAVEKAKSAINKI